MTAGAQKQAQNGDRVRVTYVGRFADGTVFDSSDGHEPLEFTVGGGEVIAGFDAAVTGLNALVNLPRRPVRYPPGPQ